MTDQTYTREDMARAWDEGSHATAYSGVTYTDNPYRNATRHVRFHVPGERPTEPSDRFVGRPDLTDGV